MCLGCAGTAKVQEVFSGQQAHLEYPGPPSQDLSGSVVISAYTVDSPLPPSLQVERRRSLIIPLLIFNYWQHHFEIRPGKETFSPALAAFGMRSLARDLRAAGAQSAEPAGIRVKVRIVGVRTGLEYARGGVFSPLNGNPYRPGRYSENIFSAVSAQVILESREGIDTLSFEEKKTVALVNRDVSPDIEEASVIALGETLSGAFRQIHGRILAAVSERLSRP